MAPPPKVDGLVYDHRTKKCYYSFSPIKIHQLQHLSQNNTQTTLNAKITIEFKKNLSLTKEILSKDILIKDQLIKICHTPNIQEKYLKRTIKTDEIKALILSTINKILKSGKIDKIYFTDFHST